jgi:hypothetical protein
MSRGWLTVNFPTDRAISISPRRAAERLSLYLLTRHEAQRRPLSFETMLNRQGRRMGGQKPSARTYGSIMSNYPVEQLLGSCFQIEPSAHG